MGMSNPHFLYADPWLEDQIIGLKADEEEHKNHFLLEPVSYIIIKVLLKTARCIAVHCVVYDTRGHLQSV